MNFPIWPPIISEYGAEVDLLLAFILAIITLLSVPVFVLLIVFAARYRRGAKVDRSHQPKPRTRRMMELSWTAIPAGFALVFFVWAARLFFQYDRPPDNGLEISVVAKQWMWKFQHPTGQREINELHVPTGRPIKFKMISEDVIHSLYFPALRVKHDVLPGYYTSLWFQADKTGVYHLLCAEFCGTEHSQMGGQIVVLAPAAYERWLERTPSVLSLAQRGAQHYRSFGCSGCHEHSDVVRAPPLEGVFGSPVPLASGKVIVADEGYIRDSILLPKKDVVAGYQPVMPSFQNRIGEEQLIELIAYIKSIAIAKEYRR
jgi:cytochrome c oxidase subunit 2